LDLKELKEHKAYREQQAPEHKAHKVLAEPRELKVQPV
jgi:hypothetical protein